MDNFLNLIDRHIDAELSRYKNQYYDQNIKKKKKRKKALQTSHWNLKLKFTRAQHNEKGVCFCASY